jgi:hypothetical protein
METIASFPTSSLSGHHRALEICLGDVTDTTTPVDVLCCSAFPNDYTPFSHGVIGALHKRGIDVHQLAGSKAFDLRSTWRCWASAEMDHPIRRVVCFEHEDARPGQAPPDMASLVGNVFRTVREVVLSQANIPLTNGEHVLDTIRLPLLATGDQGVDRGMMVESIIRQAYLSLVGQLPVRRVQFVLRPDVPNLPKLMIRIGRAYELVRMEIAQMEDKKRQGKDYEFDYFISYRHDDRKHVDPVVDALKELRKGVRLFIDRDGLAVGRFWKPALMEALASSSHGLCFLTDNYPTSPECMDEFHASVCISRVPERRGFLIPLVRLDKTALMSLPASIRNVHLQVPERPDADARTVAGQVVRLSRVA